MTQKRGKKQGRHKGKVEEMGDAVRMERIDTSGLFDVGINGHVLMWGSLLEY